MLQEIPQTNFRDILLRTEPRFVFTGISTYEVDQIIDACEDVFGFYYDYKFFLESEVFGTLLQLNCYYFFPYGFRLKDVAITEEEVKNLYWY